MFVHPHFRRQPESLPLLIAHHIRTINDGGIVKPEHVELYGATFVGLNIETSDQTFCGLADSMQRP